MTINRFPVDNRIYFNIRQSGIFIAGKWKAFRIKPFENILHIFFEMPIIFKDYPCCGRDFILIHSYRSFFACGSSYIIENVVRAMVNTYA